MDNNIRLYLIDLCAKNKTIGYQELSNSCKLGLDMSLSDHRNKMADLLEDVLKYEYVNTRPLLTAIVIAKELNMQGDGFFKIAEELGFGSWKILKKGDFDIQQIKLCFDFWSNDDNYKKYKVITNS